MLLSMMQNWIPGMPISIKKIAIKITKMYFRIVLLSYLQRNRFCLLKFGQSEFSQEMSPLAWNQKMPLVDGFFKSWVYSRVMGNFGIGRNCDFGRSLVLTFAKMLINFWCCYLPHLKYSLSVLLNTCHTHLAEFKKVVSESGKCCGSGHCLVFKQLD